MVCYPQPENCRILPLTSVPWLLLPASDNTAFAVLPWKSLQAQRSVHPFIPLCPVLLIFIHQFVYTTQGSGRKGQKYLLSHIAWSRWGCQNMELTGLYIMTSWMFLSPPPQPPLDYIVSCLLCHLLRLESWNLCHMPKHSSAITVTVLGKSQQPPACLCSPLCENSPSHNQAQPAPDAARGTPGMGNPTKALISAQEPASPLQTWELISVRCLCQVAQSLVLLGCWNPLQCLKSNWDFCPSARAQEEGMLIPQRISIRQQQGTVRRFEGWYETGSPEMPCGQRPMLAPVDSHHIIPAASHHGDSYPRLQVETLPPLALTRERKGRWPGFPGVCLSAVTVGCCLYRTLTAPAAQVRRTVGCNSQ